jgi:hypothetical protein
MKMLSYRQSLNADDLMAVVYYLLLQDRVSEAMSFFNQIANSQHQLQYDYLRAYLDFYTGEIDHAREIAKQYANYPVPRWQHLFQSVLDQTSEVLETSKVSLVADKEDREQIQTQMAATETSFQFTVESKQIRVNYQNLTNCTVNYYPMDIELLFSRNPFVREQTDQFAFIVPNETTEIPLPTEETHFIFGLPEKFHNSNLMIEIVGNGVKKSQVYYANSLNVQVIENYGQVKVSHQETRKALSRVYVKVYARMKGREVRFFKDGYTDLRGRFDYVSLNTNELDHAERFAILILSEEYGAVIHEAGPPKR